MPVPASGEDRPGNIYVGPAIMAPAFRNDDAAAQKGRHAQRDHGNGAARELRHGDASYGG